MRAHLVGIGEEAAQHPELDVGHRRLKILYLGAEGREVELRAAVPELGLEPDLEMIDLLGPDRPGLLYRDAVSVGREAILVDPDGLGAARIGAIGEHVGRNFVAQRQVVGEVSVGILGRAFLWLEDAKLGAAARVGLGAGQLGSVAGEHTVPREAAPLIVVEPHAGLDVEGFRHLPAHLPEECKAGALAELRVARGEPIEDGRVVRQRIGRVDRPGAGGW